MSINSLFEVNSDHVALCKSRSTQVVKYRTENASYVSKESTGLEWMPDQPYSTIFCSLVQCRVMREYRSATSLFQW